MASSIDILPLETSHALLRDQSIDIGSHADSIAAVAQREFKVGAIKTAEEQHDIKQEATKQDGLGGDRSKKRKRRNKEGANGEQRDQHQENQHKSKKARGDQSPLTGVRGDPLLSLKKGLHFVLNSFVLNSPDSQEFAQEVRLHASELQNMLFRTQTHTETTSSLTGVTIKIGNDAPVSPPPSSSQPPTPSAASSTKVLNPHTELPPPFALPDPKAFARGPSAAMSLLNMKAPSTSSYAHLPPAFNFSTTTLPPAPQTTTLPALPQITDISLFHAPFTHTSALASYIPPTNTNSYEPLEFLGDAYLEVIATRLIHSRFPLHTVGQKAGLREIIVKNETLAEYSRAYGFTNRIKTSDAIKQQQGPAWTKVLADVFEAYVACIVIQDASDNGFRVAENWLTELWAPKILEWKAKGDGAKDTTNSGPAQLDAKTDLNKLVVGKESKLEYLEERPMEMIMPGNRQNFFIGVYLTGLGYEKQRLGTGEGRSKQLAGMAAAADALLNSQDIITVANRKKTEAERAGKKKAHLERNKGNSFDRNRVNAHSVNPRRGFNFAETNQTNRSRFRKFAGTVDEKTISEATEGSSPERKIAELFLKAFGL